MPAVEPFKEDFFERVVNVHWAPPKRRFVIVYSTSNNYRVAKFDLTGKFLGEVTSSLPSPSVEHSIRTGDIDKNGNVCATYKINPEFGSSNTVLKIRYFDKSSTQKWEVTLPRSPTFDPSIDANAKFDKDGNIMVMYFLSTALPNDSRTFLAKYSSSGGVMFDTVNSPPLSTTINGGLAMECDSNGNALTFPDSGESHTNIAVLRLRGPGGGLLWERSFPNEVGILQYSNNSMSSDDHGFIYCIGRAGGSSGSYNLHKCNSSGIMSTISFPVGDFSLAVSPDGTGVYVWQGSSTASTLKKFNRNLALQWTVAESNAYTRIIAFDDVVIMVAGAFGGGSAPTPIRIIKYSKDGKLISNTDSSLAEAHGIVDVSRD
jgi:hypothetical protein